MTCTTRCYIARLVFSFSFAVRKTTTPRTISTIMQDLLFAQLWQEPQADMYCPFSIFNASVDFADEEEFLPANVVENSGFLEHLDHSNSSLDSLESTVSSPIDGLFVHDNLFGEIEDDLSIKDCDSPIREEVESPVSVVSAKNYTFGSFQLQMTEELEGKFDLSEDEIQEDSEEEPSTPKRGKLTTTTTRITKQAKTKTPEAKVAKKPRSNGGRKKRATPAACSDHDHDHNDGNVQSSCCLSGCSNAVTNRLRFSLRRSYTFKNDFLEKNWNKVCTYHYFSDLYVWKKVQGGNKAKN